MRRDSSMSARAIATARGFDLTTTFVVMRPDQTASTAEVTPTVFEELDRRFDGFCRHLLVSCFEFDADWSTWERHPAGDEFICLISGRAMLVLERESGEDVVHLDAPGACALVPKGTWHTARTSTPTRMLFVTPGEGTENRPVQPEG